MKGKMLSSSHLRKIGKYLNQFWEKKTDEKGIILLDSKISMYFKTFDILTLLNPTYMNILKQSGTLWIKSNWMEQKRGHNKF